MKITEKEIDELVKHQAELRYAAELVQRAASGTGIKSVHRNQFTTISKILENDGKILKKEIKHSKMAVQITGEIKVIERAIGLMDKKKYNDLIKDCSALISTSEVLRGEFQAIIQAAYGRSKTV
jgi:hypothetical protein